MELVNEGFPNSQATYNGGAPPCGILVGDKIRVIDFSLVGKFNV